MPVEGGGSARAGAGLIAQAQSWAAQDPDDRTRTELLGTIEAARAHDPAATAELADAFAGRLQFGTAGLRGRLGPGPNRMNRVVVMQAAAGLAAYLSERGGDGVAIGFDARHNSDVFARDTAAVLAGAGLTPLLLPRPLPTPVLAYAVRHLGCAAGVMVTASHNPPQDNGYKVYLGEGSQIVPPSDAEISACIADVAGRPLGSIPLSDEWTILGDDVLDDYVAQVASLVRQHSPRQARVVYTPLHGVGGETFERVIEQAGFPLAIRVDAQFEPDPDFPTVAFPNPEEPGAIDLAIDEARRSGADLVIANDPDADRCAVAIPIPGSASDWRMLTGDEVGALLGWWMIERGVTSGTFARSLVSSSMLDSIAAANGLASTQTLTGFKWIAKVPGLEYGYEEALGYCVDPSSVRDKDGISAALLIIEMAAELKERGRLLTDALDDLSREHGIHATSQVSIRVSDLERITRIMHRLRTSPPADVAGTSVIAMDDLEQPTDGLPPTDGLRFTLAGGARIIVRPSGTEPKIKCYLEVIEHPLDGNLAAAHALAANRMEGLRSAVAAWLE
ncbi:MAG: phospho-sugar mutase [Actinobacteria bacterium]|nr:phospho-sugar mutase [Actinomycetota bacterium]